MSPNNYLRVPKNKADGITKSNSNTLSQTNADILQGSLEKLQQSKENLPESVTEAGTEQTKSKTIIPEANSTKESEK